jgi:Zn ribbon nucleic-acid-binding protein
MKIPSAPSFALQWTRANDAFNRDWDRSAIRRILPEELCLANRCPKCRGADVIPWKQGDDAGTLCIKCGWSKRDLKTFVEEYMCECGRKMGEFWRTEGVKYPKLICGWCYERRRHRDVAPKASIWVRREVFCMTGCGKLLAWTDFPETVPTMEAMTRSQYLCEPCHKAGKGSLQRLFVRKHLHPLAAFEVFTSPVNVDITNISGAVGSASTTIQQAVQAYSFGYGKAIFGDGADGTLTLGSNTVAASGDNVKRFTSLNCAGFSYSSNAADFYEYVYAKVVVSLGTNGTLQSGTAGATGGAAGAGATNTNGGAGGAGGVGGTGACAIWVFAFTVTGTGTIGSPGGNGGNGGNSTGSIGGVSVAATNGGSPGATTNAAWGISFGGANPTNGSGSSGTNAVTGGAGGTITPGADVRYQKVWQDWVDVVGFTAGSSITAGTNRKWASQGAGGGGGGGTTASPNPGGSGGGASGGGAGAFGNGGAGNTSAAGGGAAGGMGGGGAAAGGGGCFAFLFSTNVPSTLTFSVAGGNGGNGGTATGPGGTVGAGAGGGGGGIGGFIAQSGSGATTTAAGGTLGTGGASGAAGGAGLMMPMTYN